MKNILAISNCLGTPDSPTPFFIDDINNITEPDLKNAIIYAVSSNQNGKDFSTNNYELTVYSGHLYSDQTLLQDYGFPFL